MTLAGSNHELENRKDPALAWAAAALKGKNTNWHKLIHVMNGPVYSVG